MRIWKALRKMLIGSLCLLGNSRTLASEHQVISVRYRNRLWTWERVISSQRFITNWYSKIPLIWRVRDQAGARLSYVLDYQTVSMPTCILTDNFFVIAPLLKLHNCRQRELSNAMAFLKILQPSTRESALVSYFNFIIKRLTFSIIIGPVMHLPLECITVDHLKPCPIVLI